MIAYNIDTPIGKDRHNSSIESSLGVRKARFLSSILLLGTGVRKTSYVACGFSPVKIHFSDYPKV